MGIQSVVTRIAGVKPISLAPLDVSGQSPTGGSGGTDKPVFLNGKAFRFNCVNQPWAFMGSRSYPNLFRSEIRLGFEAPYDDARDRPYLRSELTEQDRLGNTGLEQWLTFDICMLDTSNLQPYPPTSPPGQAMICQIKTYPDVTGNPVFRLEARSNCVRGVTSSNNGGTPTTDIVVDRYLGGPLQRGVTENFLVRIVRSADGATNGVCQVWRNGVLVVNDSGIALGRSDTQYIWRKWGLYCRDTVVSCAALHSNTDIGTDLSYLLTRPYPMINPGL